MPGATTGSPLTESLEEPVEEDLRLPLFIAGDVLPAPCGEFGELFPARHDEVLHEPPPRGNSELVKGLSSVSRVSPVRFCIQPTSSSCLLLVVFIKR